MNTKKITEDNLLETCFSFNGTLGRLEFLGYLWLLSIINGYCSNIIALILSLPLFYTTLVITQKRCRDCNCSGTTFILIYSIYYLMFICWLYMKPFKEQLKEILTQHNYIAYICLCVFILYVCSLLLLLLIPGKKEKNLNLRSPLLNTPWKYIGICYIVYLISLFALIYWHLNYY